MWLLGENHLYHGEGVAFDPEGLLSTLPAITNVTFGYAGWKMDTGKGQELGRTDKTFARRYCIILIALGWDIFSPDQ